MNSILTLTNNLSYLKSTNEKIIVLDKIFDLKKSEDLNYKNIQVIQNKCKDKKELINAYEYCNNIYIKLLKDLTIELNRIHGLKKNTESWEVIIGKWLLEFIYICHKNFVLCAKILSEEYEIDCDIWSVTSFNELRKNGLEVERKNLLNPKEKKEKSYIEKCLEKRDGPIIAVTDYVRSFSDQIRPFTSKPFYSVGTDGFGRSDTRKNLRKFFEVDKEHIVAYTLSILASEQLIGSENAEKAFKKYNIDQKKIFPTKI